MTHVCPGAGKLPIKCTHTHRSKSWLWKLRSCISMMILSCFLFALITKFQGVGLLLSVGQSQEVINFDWPLSSRKLSNYSKILKNYLMNTEHLYFIMWYCLLFYILFLTKFLSLLITVDMSLEEESSQWILNTRIQELHLFQKIVLQGLKCWDKKREEVFVYQVDHILYSTAWSQSTVAFTSIPQQSVELCVRWVLTLAMTRHILIVLLQCCHHSLHQASLLILNT